MAVHHRGDIFWVDFEPGRGVGQTGRRPALIVQNYRGNQHSSATVVAAVSSAPLPRVYPFMVLLAPGEANLARGGHVNCARLLTVDESRLISFIGTLGADKMREVAAALRYELDI